MSTGLIALLDDVAGIAKIAAASLDDAAGQAARAGVKAAGVVVDDAAVTPRYVVGFTADRELPIIWRIALGSLKNKIIILLPAALLLSIFAPWLITPLLMLGGLFLCYEGAEKAVEALWPHAEHHGPGGVLPTQVADPAKLEQEKISGAVKTDLILSAEIMAITLSTVAADTGSYWMQALVLAVVGIGITVIVYGAVALIVKADDAGVALATSRRLGPVGRGVGRGLVKGMPVFLKLLATVGTAAMLWVGGGIVIHGLEEFGITGPGHFIHDAAELVGHAVPGLEGFLAWLVTAALSGIVGLILGLILIPLVHKVLAPAVASVRGKPAVH